MTRKSGFSARGWLVFCSAKAGLGCLPFPVAGLLQASWQKQIPYRLVTICSVPETSNASCVRTLDLVLWGRRCYSRSTGREREARGG